MRKSIELTDEQVEAITNYQKEKGLRNFSVAISSIVDNFLKGSDSGMSNEQFALLGDAIVKMDKKIDILIETTAPKSAGEI